MIDLLTENVLTVAEAAKHKAFRRNGKPAHVSKIGRLMDVGTKVDGGARIKLEWVRTEAGKQTSSEAILRYFNRLNPNNVSRSATTQDQDAEGDLRAAGLM